VSTFTWLQLTDFHAGMAEQDRIWPRTQKSFFDDLDALRPKTGPIDAVFFTGDLTQTGSEFELVDEFLTSLRPHLGTPIAPLLAVPGNHDLVRPTRTAVVRMLTSHWLDDDEVRREFGSARTANTARPSYRHLLITRDGGTTAGIVQLFKQDCCRETSPPQ
jgi:3',5'-cyclic AMP phosphodiesterase CpdA